MLTEKGGGKKGASPDDLKMDAVSALGAIASAKDEDVIKTLETLNDPKSKNKALISATRDAIKKIKGRNS